LHDGRGGLHIGCKGVQAHLDAKREEKEDCQNAQKILHRCVGVLQANEISYCDIKNAVQI
jgi:hypothetical protein